MYFRNRVKKDYLSEEEKKFIKHVISLVDDSDKKVDEKLISSARTACYILVRKVIDNEEQYYEYVEVFKKLCNKNTSNLCFLVGMLMSNLPNKYSKDEVISMLEFAFENGYIYAASFLGVLYSSSNERYFDIDKAIDCFEYTTSHNMKCDFTFYAELLLEYFPQNKRYVEKAISLLKEKIEDNDLDAILDLAKIYLTGAFVEKNIDYSYKLLEKASRLGDLDSTIYLSDAYLLGFDGKKNRQKAFKYSLRLANKFYSAKGMYDVAMYYLEGSRTKKKEKEGIFYCKTAATLGYPKAICALGNFYLHGLHNFPINTKRGISLLKKSASLDCLEALYELSGIYKNGEFVKKNLKKANEYELKAEQLKSELLPDNYSYKSPCINGVFPIDNFFDSDD